MGLLRSLCLLVLVFPAFSQTRRTVDELVGFVRTAIQQKEDDRKVAAAVQGIRLANRLDEKTVEDLQRSGAGPRTVAALEKLREASAGLPATAATADLPPSLPPAPAPAELKRLIAEVRENALHYTDSLPNYVCTQVTNRKVDPTGSESWRAVDQILERLTFFEQKESYKVMMVNSRPNTSDLTHEKLGGATSSGEFGSILHAIFAPETQTEFQWERWTGLRKRWAYVLSFETGQPMYTIQHGPSQKSVTVRVRGSVYADRDTKMVVRIKMEATAIPADFPIQAVSLDLNYDFADIAGQEFLLPLQADIRSREGRYLSWNQASYVSYHKYGAETSITFDAPAIPDDKLKEQPPPAKKK